MNETTPQAPRTSDDAPPSTAGLELPPLTEGLLEDAVLVQLESDLESCTEVLGILAKAHREAHIEPAAGLALHEAFARLRRREVRAIQVRYRYQGVEWWDSLLVLPIGYRLIRIQHAAV